MNTAPTFLNRKGGRSIYFCKKTKGGPENDVAKTIKRMISKNKGRRRIIERL